MAPLDQRIGEVNRKYFATAGVETQEGQYDVLVLLALRHDGINAEMILERAVFVFHFALGEYLGFGPRISQESIQACEKFLSKDSNRKIADIPNVSVERMQVLPAGVGILAAILAELELTEIVYADAALREGVLYTMDDRLKADDIRERTAMDLVNQYTIDRAQAERVKQTSEQVFDALAEHWNLNDEDRHMLIWAAMLHEIGLPINYSGFHRHGAYILGNTPLPGFNREQQDVLAILVRLKVQCHMRRTLDVMTPT